MAKINPGISKKFASNFDGKIFHNQAADPVHRGLAQFIKLRMTHRRSPWPDWLESVPREAPAGRIKGGDLRVTFVNHATVLIQTAGLNLLTDPIWSTRSSPFAWVGPRRIRQAGLRLEDLPPLDAVLVSHDHYDHLDLATLKILGKRHATRFFSGLGTRIHFRKAGLAHRLIEMDWWDRIELPGGVGLHYVPAQHFSGRTLWDRFETLWGGFALEAKEGPVYFCGDSGYCGHFQEFRQRLGSPRLAILPVGAYEPRWFMRHMHMDPSAAVQAYRDLRAHYAVGIHYGTFQLTDEPHDAPPQELLRVLQEQGIPPGRFRTLDFGQAWDVPR
jgi:L-ascorbate metabolism protein UlaG (beta-lactamase superfamily)